MRRHRYAEDRLRILQAPTPEAAAGELNRAADVEFDPAQGLPPARQGREMVPEEPHPAPISVEFSVVERGEIEQPGGRLGIARRHFDAIGPPVITQWVRHLALAAMDARACQQRLAALHLLEPRRVGGQRMMLNHLGQVPPGHVIHAIVRLTVLLADLVDGHDVRVVQSGGGLGLGPETLEGVGVGELATQQHFDRDRSIEADLLGEQVRATSASGRGRQVAACGNPFDDHLGDFQRSRRGG